MEGGKRYCLMFAAWLAARFDRHLELASFCTIVGVEKHDAMESMCLCLLGEMRFSSTGERKGEEEVGMDTES